MLCPVCRGFKKLDKHGTARVGGKYECVIGCGNTEVDQFIAENWSNPVFRETYMSLEEPIKKINPNYPDPTTLNIVGLRKLGGKLKIKNAWSIRKADLLREIQQRMVK